MALTQVSTGGIKDGQVQTADLANGQVTAAKLHADALDRTYTLGAVGSDHYTFTGEGLTGAVNDPTLYLTRGKTYRFVNGNSSGAHPFRIQSTTGTSGTEYNTGVTNNAGGGGSTIIFEVPHAAPDVLYYQCTAHANMNGILYITGRQQAATGASNAIQTTDGSGNFTASNTFTISGDSFIGHDINLVSDSSNQPPVLAVGNGHGGTVRCAITAPAAFGSILDDSGLQLGRNTEYVKIKAPADQTGQASYDLTLPINAGTNGQALVTNGSGVTSWSTIDLTALSASNLTSGTIPDARFPATLPAVSGANLTGISGIPAGVIAIWSGATNAIPTGWVICDGNNSTPDLRDRFVVGAGNTYSVANTGGATSTTTQVSVNGNTGWASQVPNASSNPNASPEPQNSRDRHQHGWGGTFTTSSFGILPPYYALAYIMKT